jgi:hypothetical protein
MEKNEVCHGRDSKLCNTACRLLTGGRDLVKPGVRHVCSWTINQVVCSCPWYMLTLWTVPNWSFQNKHTHLWDGVCIGSLPVRSKTTYNSSLMTQSNFCTPVTVLVKKDMPHISGRTTYRVHSNGILLRNQREWSTDASHNVNEPLKCYERSERGQTLSPLMKCPE